MIRSLRPALDLFDSSLQNSTDETSLAAVRLQADIEPHERTKLSDVGDQLASRALPSTVDSATRYSRAPRVAPFAVMQARSSRLSAAIGAANIVALARRGAKGAASHRAASSKPQLPRFPTRQQGPSIIFHEMAGALDMIVGVAGTTSELRARLKPAFAALAADYGLRIAHMTLNGVSVERATGSKGG